MRPINSKDKVYLYIDTVSGMAKHKEIHIFIGIKQILRLKLFKKGSKTWRT
jgi:hypothetical protein